MDEIDLNEERYTWLPSIEILQNIDKDSQESRPALIKHIFEGTYDINEINNYVDIIINMEQIDDGKKVYRKYPMKLCDVKDF